MHITEELLGRIVMNCDGALENKPPTKRALHWVIFLPPRHSTLILLEGPRGDSARVVSNPEVLLGRGSTRVLFV